jgi:hypothetical protein
MLLESVIPSKIFLITDESLISNKTLIRAIVDSLEVTLLLTIVILNINKKNCRNLIFGRRKIIFSLKLKNSWS